MTTTTIFQFLPDRELVAARMHEQWMKQKLARGITSHKLESGEECMVPYDELSEAAKDLDRGMVNAFYEVLDEVSNE